MVTIGCGGTVAAMGAFDAGALTGMSAAIVGALFAARTIADVPESNSARIALHPVMIAPKTPEIPVHHNTLGQSPGRRFNPFHAKVAVRDLYITAQ